MFFYKNYIHLVQYIFIFYACTMELPYGARARSSTAKMHFGQREKYETD